MSTLVLAFMLGSSMLLLLLLVLKFLIGEEQRGAATSKNLFAPFRTLICPSFAENIGISMIMLRASPYGLNAARTDQVSDTPPSTCDWLTVVFLRFDWLD